MRRSLLIGVAMAVSGSILVGAQAPAAGPDRFDGTWKLNVEKST